MAVPQVVSGVGAGSKRVDKNNVERVQRIQKNAQIQNASGGAYGDRARNEGLAQGAPMDVPGGGGPDQAALNILLSLEPYKSITKFNTHEDDWACQCGTTVDPNKIDVFRGNFLVKTEPVWRDNDSVYNNKDDKYVLVHQYNRVPEWNEKLRKKYE
jgi:hypothetical protein